MYIFMILIYLLTGFSFIFFLLTGIQGYFEFYVINANHAIFGFFTAIIYLFTEVLVMFFFVGTGISIKDYIKEKGVSTEFHKKSLENSSKINKNLKIHTVLPWISADFVEFSRDFL